MNHALGVFALSAVSFSIFSAHVFSFVETRQKIGTKEVSIFSEKICDFASFQDRRTYYLESTKEATSIDLAIQIVIIKALKTKLQNSYISFKVSRQRNSIFCLAVSQNSFKDKVHVSLQTCDGDHLHLLRVHARERYLERRQLFCCNVRLFPGFESPAHTENRRYN